jgi:hypothetical protein
VDDMIQNPMDPAAWGSTDDDAEEFGDPAAPGIIHVIDLTGEESRVRRLVRTSPVSPPSAERGLSYEEIVANTRALRRGGSDQTDMISTPRRIRFDREPTPYHRRSGGRRARARRVRGSRRITSD